MNTRTEICQNEIKKLEEFKSDLEALYKKHGVSLDFDKYENEVIFKDYDENKTSLFIECINVQIKRNQGLLNQYKELYK